MSKGSSSSLALRLQIDAQLSCMLVLGILTKPSPQPAKDPWEVSSPSSMADCPSRHYAHRHYIDTHLGQFIQKKLQGAGEMVPQVKHLPCKYGEQSSDPQNPQNANGHGIPSVTQVWKAETGKRAS